MIPNTRTSCAGFLLFTLVTVPIMARAADEACAGVTQKCTKDKTYDKPINGSVYSCYDCKQALCKDGGNGGISGTTTSSVCTEKATTFRPISLDDQLRGGDTLAPKPTASRRPGRAVDPRPEKFDEADALFGKRLDATGANQRKQRDHCTHRRARPVHPAEKPVRHDEAPTFRGQHHAVAEAPDAKSCLSTEQG